MSSQSFNFPLFLVYLCRFVGRSRYVTFLRVEDELMKIVAVETYPNPDPEIDPEKGAKCQRLTVERGLDGSAPRAAATGAAILAPLYTHTPIWGTSSKASGRLSYQADYQSFYAWSSLANFTVGAGKVTSNQENLRSQFLL